MTQPVRPQSKGAVDLGRVRRDENTTTTVKGTGGGAPVARTRLDPTQHSEVNVQGARAPASPGMERIAPLPMTACAKAAQAKNREELRSVEQGVRDAAQVLKLSDTQVERIIKPSEVHEGWFKVKLEDGSVVGFPFHRIRFGRPAKGGIRFHSSVTQAQIQALALEMDLKIRVSGLPLRGGKGGVGAGVVLESGSKFKVGMEVKPEELSEADRCAMGGAFRRAFGPYDFGPEVDVPAPDLYTTPKVMAAFLDADEELKGFREPATVTGKPVLTDHGHVLAEGGNVLRSVSTGLGVVFNAERAAKEVGLPLEDATAVVQGTGEVGMAAIEALGERHADVVALSDIKGAIRLGDPDHDVEHLREFVQEHGTAVGLPGAKTFSAEELLTQQVDIVIPAAASGQIDDKVAQEIIDSGTAHGRTKIVVEGANGPSTYEGAALLDDAKNVLRVPDILGNVGGVVGSYFEMLQNQSGRPWTADETSERLRAVVDQAFTRANASAKEHKVSLADGAYLNAVRELAGVEDEAPKAAFEWT